MLRRSAAVGGVVMAMLGGITWLALESGDVVRLRTREADGATRTTRVWIAEDDGSAWVEAATPDRPFLQDLRREPHAEVEGEGTRRAMIAELVPNPDGHARVRRLLRAKYGWADVWVGLLQDTSASVAVRLRPIAPAPAG